MSYNRYSPDIHEDGSGHFYCRFEELSAEFQAEIANIMTNHTNSIYTGTDLTGTGSSIPYNIPTSVGGDLYVNVETWNVYKATATSVWDYVGNIKGEKGDEGPRAAFYGTCSTYGTIAEKIVSCEGFELKKGNIIVITFSNTGQTDTFTLNVNSTGAKSVIIGDTAVGASNPLKWRNYTTLAFMYNGTSYSLLSVIDSSINQNDGARSPARGANTWWGSCTTNANVAAKEVTTIYTFVPYRGAIVSIGFAHANTADELTLNINGTGAKPIRINGAATSSSNKLEWDAGDRILFMLQGDYYAFLCKAKDLTKVSDLTNDLNFIDASGAPVQSVNGQTGDVVLDADDVGALPDDTVIPTDTADLTNSAGYITSSDIPVTSVNSQTGDITLDADDVGALPDDTSIPTDTADLTNSAGFITIEDVDYPVTSVNTQTGDVVLSIPTDTADLTNSAGYITSYTETDPIFSASAASGIDSTDITNWNSKTSNTGTVTSVRVQASSPVQSSTDTEQTASLNTTISLASGYGDTQNPYGSKTANYVLAAPNGSAGTPSFRALVADDIPSITKSKVSDFPTDVSSFTNDSGYVIGSGTAKIYVSSSTPSSPSEGDIWIDTSSL